MGACTAMTEYSKEGQQQQQQQQVKCGLVWS